VVRRVGIVVLAVALGSCDDHVLGDGVPIGVTCLREPPLTYENFGEAILQRHCLPCHSANVRPGQRASAPIDVNFDSWDEVLAWSDRIQARGVVDQNMPPAGGMVPSERDQLAEWLRCEVLPATGVFEPAEGGE
jgi:hypothetical protein